jgi:thymidine phosphorylase
MAKKVAIGANHLVLDIPVGKTIKIRHFADAEKVADKFKLLGKKFGIETITDINEALEPAGHGVGPALEARDVLAVLKQRPGRPLKLESKALRLAGKLLNICYKDSKIFPTKNGEDEAKKILVSGQALNKFREIVKTQKGDLNLVDAEKFEMKSLKKEIKIKHSGKIKEINNYI